MFLSYGALKISKEESVVPCDSSYSSKSLLNQTTPCTQVVIGKHENQFVNLSPSSPIQDLNTNFNRESDWINDIVSSWHISFPPSDIPYDPHDPPLSHKPVITVSSDSQEDQVQDEVSGDQEPCDIFHNDYVWDSIFE